TSHLTKKSTHGKGRRNTKRILPYNRNPQRKTATPVLINPKLDKVLIGVITLEALALKVDPKSGKLEKTELLLL
ncbi:MAG: aspartyl protease, partial [Candidatus Bathyarchaeia archaeon]